MPSQESPDGSDSPIERETRDTAPAEQYTQSINLHPGLYIVSTPIGNLRDVTLRALDVLRSVDCIYAEDTRTTRKLLDAYAIKTPLSPYHDHNGATVRPKIVETLSEGARFALVSDAGTPLVSDPGFKLVRDAIAAGISVVPVPGASATLAALTGAGLTTDQFFFGGFLPPKPGARQKRLQALKAIKATLILFESGPRLADTLQDIENVFGDTPVVIARELTKLFEEFRRGSAANLLAGLDDNARRGEIVLLIDGAASGNDVSDADIDAAIREMLPALSVKEIASTLAQRFDLPRKTLYDRVLTLKKT